jgi:hypothetical protein
MEHLQLDDDIESTPTYVMSPPRSYKVTHPEPQWQPNATDFAVAAAAEAAERQLAKEIKLRDGRARLMSRLAEDKRRKEVAAEAKAAEAEAQKAAKRAARETERARAAAASHHQHHLPQQQQQQQQHTEEQEFLVVEVAQSTTQVIRQHVAAVTTSVSQHITSKQSLQPAVADDDSSEFYSDDGCYDRRHTTKWQEIHAEDGWAALQAHKA